MGTHQIAREYSSCCAGRFGVNESEIEGAGLFLDTGSHSGKLET